MLKVAVIRLLMLLSLFAQGIGAVELKSAAIDPGKLNQWLSSQQPPLVVDVRSPDEFSSGHIPRAVNIPLPLLARRLDEMRKAADLVLYCNDSRLTRMAERILMQKRLHDFMHLHGGLNAWEAARLPIENSLE